MGLLQYLFSRPGAAGDAFRQWGFMLIGAYAALAVAILLLGWVMRTFSEYHAVNSRLTRRIVTWGVLLQIVGLLILGLRATDFPLLSLRLWIFLHLAAEVAAAGFLIRWMRTRYREELEVYEWEERKRAYLPRASRRR